MRILLPIHCCQFLLFLRFWIGTRLLLLLLPSFVFSLFLLLCKYTTGNAFFFFCFFCNSIPIYSLLFGVPLFLLLFKHFIYSFLTSFPSVRSSIVILNYGSVSVRPYSKNFALVKTHKTNEQSHEERQNSACKNFNYSQTMHRVFCVHCAGNG